ncbi:MAG: pyruvate formate-lyase-activating protein [Actinomycetes bacterium]
MTTAHEVSVPGHDPHNLPPELQDGSRVGFVHSSETTSGVNGPGLRYTVFVAGCPLRCLYCHNPDTQNMRLGQRTTVKRVLDDTARYGAFIAKDGGLTITGGEPLLQPDFVEDIFVGAKTDLGLHTCLDTSGMGGMRASDRLLEHTDLVLLDIKAGNPALYEKVTTYGDFSELMQFAGRLLDHGTRLWIRLVLVPGLTDSPENVAEVADICADLRDVIDRVEVLPYHTLGVAKYEALGRAYPLVGVPVPTKEQVNAALAIFRSRDLYAIA